MASEDGFSCRILRANLVAALVAFVLTPVGWLDASPQGPPAVPTVAQTGNTFRLSGYRTHVGETFRVRVTGALGSGARGIWGTDVYTDDSNLSAAVVHAGLLAPGQEGEVLITFLPGQSQYQGSARNGVTTMSFDSFPVSYRLARTDAASAAIPELPPPTTPSVSNVVFTSSVNSLPFNLGLFSDVGPLDDQGVWQLLGGQPLGAGVNASPNLMGLRKRVGESFEFEVTGATAGNVWGDGIYTDDSELGPTAVQAGFLRPGERGSVRITVLPGQRQYGGTARNGVTSQSFDSWEGSFRVERTRDVTSSVSPAASPMASIGGRIKDSTGKPLRGVRVAAAVVVFRDGRLTISETNTTVTSPEGEYLFPAVLPGSYLIMATLTLPQTWPTASPALTYFPGVSSVDAAMQLPIRGGEQAVNIDFVASPPPLFKVSGKVLNPPTAGVPTISVAQRDASKPEGVAVPLLVNGSAGAARGEFELMLPPGAWDVFPVTPTTRQRDGVPPPGVPAYTTGRASVDVIDRNVDGISVTVGSADMRGRIVVDPAIKPPAGFSASMTEIRMVPVDRAPIPLWQHARSAQVRSDGGFTLPAVPPGNYRLQLFPAIPDAYVSDIRVGQASVFSDGIVRVNSEPIEPVEIVFSAGGGTVQGDVQITPRAASAVTSGKVVLVPQAPRRQNAFLYRQESFTAAGRDFRLSSVAPGSYKIFAFENLPAGAAEMNAEFMSKYDQFGESIEVPVAGAVRISVRMVEVEE